MGGHIATSKNSNWNTPKRIVNIINELFGSVDLDPCSNLTSIVNAKIEYLLPKNDGLKDTWFKGINIFVNPPYDRTIKYWISRCSRECLNSDDNILALLPVKSDTRPWQDVIFPDVEKGLSNICYIRSRLKFGHPPSKAPAPMACCLVLWSKDDDLHNKFISVCKDLGRIHKPEFRVKLK